MKTVLFYLFTGLLVYHERVFVLIHIKELCSGVSFILNESDIVGVKQRQQMKLCKKLSGNQMI